MTSTQKYEDLAGICDSPFRDIDRGRSELVNILYVDDDSAVRELSTITLKRTGYTVTSVEDGLQAWETLHSDRYDLLITDNEMPGLTGLELVAKARLEGIQLPVIMVSGSANILNGPDFERLHFAARMQKPFAPDKLLRTVRQVLGAASDRQGGGDLFFLAGLDTLRHVTPYRPWGLNE